MYRIFQRDNDEKYIRSAIPILPANVGSSTTGSTVYPTMDNIIRIDVPNTAGSYDLTMPVKVKVIDAWFICTGVAPAAGDTMRLTNGTSTNYITDAKAMGTTATARLGWTTFDSAYTDIAVGGILRVTAAKNTNCAAQVYIVVIPVA
jgi:hypothetical protein